MKTPLICFALFAVADGVTYYKTSPTLNVGFGTASDCKTNQYMDFCVNGPLVGTDGLPVGGYIDNGIQKKFWTDPEQGGGNFAVDNGIFGLGSDGKMYMFSYENKNMLPEMKWAFQNGPMLVQDGKSLRGTSSTKFKRSGVGFNALNEIVVIVSENEVTFHEFAQLFVEVGCISAIYLDGGPYVGWSKNEGHSGLVEKAIKLQFFNN